MESPEHFPARLLALRKAAGLTQAALAERAGINSISVSSMENGKRGVPGLDTACKLAAALGCSVSDLLAAPDHRGKRGQGRRRKP